MPYLTKELKEQLTKDLSAAKEDPGVWNYLFTRLFCEYFKKTPKYATVHYISRYKKQFCAELVVALSVPTEEIETAFDEAFAEFRRRVVALYEDKKAKENGDVYRELGLIKEDGTLNI